MMLAAWTIAVPMIVTLSACATGESPLGEDVSLGITWTNFERHRMELWCGRYSIDELQLVVAIDGHEHRLDELRFPCADGRYDSRPYGVLKHGVYRAWWEAHEDRLIGSHRTDITTGGRFELDITEGVHRDLPRLFLGVEAEPVAGDPRGDDLSIEGSWTIEGMAPTSEACARYGIESVQLRLWGDDAVDLPSLRLPCERGGFDTRPEAVLRLGTHSFAWRFLDERGDPVATGERVEADLGAPGLTHFVVEPMDIDDAPDFDPLGDVASIGTSWRVNGGGASVYSCEHAGIDRVRTILYHRRDTARTNGVEIGEAPCGVGMFHSGPVPVLAEGTYAVSLVALTASGRPLQTRNVRDPLVVGGSGHYPAPPVWFDLEPIEGVVVELGWPTHPDCSTGGVETISWWLDSAAGGELMSAVGGTCEEVGNELLFESLGVGDYRLTVSGHSSDLSMRWVGSCPFAYDGREHIIHCSSWPMEP